MSHVTIALYDPSHCVDADLLGEALDGVAGPTDQVAVVVDAAGDHRTVDLDVHRGRVTVWSHQLRFEAVDCGVAVEALAASVREGIREFERSGDPRPKPLGLDVPVTADLGLGTTWAPRFGGGLAVRTLGSGLGVHGRLGGEAAVSTRLAGGLANLVEVGPGLGLDLALPHWDVFGEVEAGGAIVWGTGFPTNHASVVPVVSTALGAHYDVGASLALGLALRVNLLRVRVVAATGAGGAAEAFEEPWARLVLSVTPRFVLKSAAQVKAGGSGGHGGG